ncbi:Uma2 family endonuclease [Stratiformator vulcanicus]|uniref:Putative restriction endonuclease domain-containing protein n=1 Tax=Stratiformator vulcanicus TaxID=2527980 RepID=A0A517R6R7_9PLAN|nr:Uma2 family endonuclease [Stratiformator vulcanicus]QDT39532.1 hypothetical protein Pan189_39400 [Stratiformator vulcanicus]
MSTASPPKQMTIEEFLALPEDDSVDRMLIRGELIELPMTYRNWRHSGSEPRIAAEILKWIDTQPEPRGEVFSGEAGVLFPELESLFGIDVAYFDAEAMQLFQADDTFLTGPPTLAVEILSPSDTIKLIDAKCKDYFDGGVKVVWRVEPLNGSVTIFEPGVPPRMVSGDDEITCEPHLPGFAVPVSRFFSR